MPSHRYSKYIPFLFLIFDLISFNSGFVLANFLIYQEPILLRSDFILLQGSLTLIWILTFYLSGLNQAYREATFGEYLNKISKALVVNPLVVLVFWLLVHPESIASYYLVYTYVIFGVLAFLWRVAWYFFIRIYRSRGYNLRNVAIVGRNRVTQDLVDYFDINRGLGYRFLGFFDNESLDDPFHLGRVQIDKIKSWLIKKDVDVIFIYTPILVDEVLKELVDFSENNLIKVKLISGISQFRYTNLTIQNYGAIPTLNITALPLDKRINKIVKRGFDIVFSSFIIVTLLSWLLPLVGLLIKLESKGPIFFRQDRNGLNNGSFRIFKFRTMVVHADDQVKQAQKGDVRITRIGSFLRKSSIDELPQFINVFLGDMSVVGPRPHAIKHNEEFRKKIDRFVQRHAVKPGITGLAQAKGYRGETITFGDINGRVRLDKFYVKNWSLYFDIKIIVLTLVSMVRGSENAY